MKSEDILKGLEGILGAVQAIAPIAKALGGPAVANFADLAATGAAIGRNVLTRVEEGEAVMTEHDQAKAKTIIDRLAAINDDLAKEIAES